VTISLHEASVGVRAVSRQSVGSSRPRLGLCRKSKHRTGRASEHAVTHHVLLTFRLSQFFFHVTTAYDILRHAGVDIAKQDFLGPPR
jgi:hypothetical protein